MIRKVNKKEGRDSDKKRFNCIGMLYELICVVYYRSFKR